MTPGREKTVDASKNVYSDPWQLPHTIPTFLETDGLRTNTQFLQPERDTTNSNRLDGSELTWLCLHQLFQPVTLRQVLVFIASWTLQECFLVLNFSKCLWAFKPVWWHTSPQPMLSLSGSCLQLLLYLPITASVCHELSAGLNQFWINNLWMDLNWLRNSLWLEWFPI